MNQSGGRGRMLVTGGTGVVGAEVVHAARLAGWHVASCARRAAPGTVGWDMSAAPAPPELRQPWDVVVHTAARPRWNLPAEEAWRCNVEPVHRLADVLADGQLVGGGTRLVFVSTAFVTGSSGLGPSSADPADYRNTYEWSKAASERLALDLYQPVSVVRPPLVIGRREDGAVARFSGIYTLLHALTTSMLPVLVTDREAYFDCVSVSDVARCCLELADPRTPDGTVQVLGAGRDAMRVGDAIDDILSTLNGWRVAHGHKPVEPPQVVSPDQYQRFLLPIARKRLSARQLQILSLLEPFLPYLSTPEPLDVTWRVADMADCLHRSVLAWIAAHSGLAARQPRPWTAGES